MNLFVDDFPGAGTGVGLGIGPDGNLGVPVLSWI